MSWSFQETFAFIEPYLHEALISTCARSQIRELAAELPETTSSYYLECRLTPHLPHVDLLACMKARNGGRERLQAWLTSATQMATSSLHGLLAFCACWAQDSSPLHKQISHIWLEFDHKHNFARALSPNLLFCLVPRYFEKQGILPYAKCISARDYRRTLTAALTALLQQPMSSATWKQLCACFDQLPHGGQVIHVSAMLARTPAVLKLNLIVPKDQFLPYLQRLDWKGSFVALEALLLRYCSSVDHIKFQLAISEELLRTVELEFHFDDDTQDARELQQFVAKVQAAHLCSAAQQYALVAWPGSFRQTFPQHAWPTRLHRWLDIKLIYQVHRPLAAKAYLGFMPSVSIF